MSTVFTNAQCFDCGGMIVLVNAATTSHDGWERYECQGCKRYLAIRYTPPTGTEVSHETAPQTPPAPERL